MSFFAAAISTDVSYGPLDSELWTATRGAEFVGRGDCEDDAIEALLDMEQDERDPFGLLGSW